MLHSSVAAGLCAAEHDVLHAIAIAMSIYVSSNDDDD
jgi:hypothetical protein